MTKAKRKRGRKAAAVNAKRPGRTAPGPLTPTGGNHREATETAGRIERRRQAWHLYVYHRWSMQQIADHLTQQGLKCTAATVANDIHAWADEVKVETAATLRHGLEVELQRLDQQDRLLMPLALGDVPHDKVRLGTGKKARTVSVPVKSEPRSRLQLEAIEKLRRNSESRRKLLGLDKQPDAGVVAVEQVVQAVRGLVGDVLAMALDPEVRRQLSEVLRKRFGVIEGEVVDRG